MGGAERALGRLLAASGENKHDFLVVSLTELGVIGQELLSLGFNVVPLHLDGPLSVLRCFMQLRWLMAEFKPDVVQTWMYHADLMGGLAAYSTGNRAIAWSIRNSKVPRSSVVQWSVSKLCALLSYCVPNAIVCVAETARHAYAQAGYNRALMTVIPNGLDFSEFDETLEVLPGDRPAEGKDLIIGCVGRWHPDKGLDLLVSTAGRVAAVEPRARFVLVGRGLSWDNPELVAQIEAHNLRVRFELLGERSDIRRQLQRMDIFCMPSRTEGFPNCLAEAMAMRRLCVATDVGDAGALLGATGILIPRADVQGLSHALRSALAMPEHERIEKGKLAGVRVRELFSIDIMRIRHDDLYRKLLQE